jgi:hypothetical protein
MILNRATVAGAFLAIAALAGPAMAQSDAPAGLGCGPAMAVPSDPVARAKLEAETRRVALAFVQSGVEAQDKMITPGALFWALGLGYMDRSKYIELHTLKGGSARGMPTSHKQTINHVIVQGDLADIDMENLVVWPDFTYNQKYNNLFQVRNGKICLLKLYADAEMAKHIMPKLESSVQKK